MWEGVEVGLFGGANFVIIQQSEYSYNIFLTLQRDHFKLDWHRFNLKQKLLDKPILSEDAFEETISGKVCCKQWSWLVYSDLRFVHCYHVSA